MLKCRVKLVVLTARGLAIREEIMPAFHQPPPQLFMLTSTELRGLREIFGKLIRHDN